MNKEMFNELFKDVVVCGRCPLEKLQEMNCYIKSLNDKITIQEKENNQLKDKINKALELIYEELYDKEEKIHYRVSELAITKVTDELIKILKGDKE